MSHVIAAVSTGSQLSAIGILRLSGEGLQQLRELRESTRAQVFRYTPLVTKRTT